MKIRKLIYFTFSLFVGSIITISAFSQTDVDNYKMIYKFNTTKLVDNSRLLEVSFVAKNKKDRKDILPIYEAEIHFYNVTAEQDIELGIAKTDNEGLARLILPEGQPFKTNEEGYINFKASFKGNGGLPAKNKEIAVKDIFFELDFKDIDSVKTVILHAYLLDSLKKRIPVEKADVIFSVGGLISKMPIEEGELKDGEYDFEFPVDIRGDKNGNVKLYAILEDNRDFGNVIYMKEIDWGIFENVVKKKQNTLWSEAAPIWMYVVLSILLIGVWANFIYTIINLISISKEGKKRYI